MENFKTWDTLALVRLARILKVTTGVQTPEERKELDAVIAELHARNSFHLLYR